MDKIVNKSEEGTEQVFDSRNMMWATTVEHHLKLRYDKD